MQPVQLSLLPEEVPAPPWMMSSPLGAGWNAAVALLARLIAAAAASAEGDGDE